MVWRNALHHQTGDKMLEELTLDMGPAGLTHNMVSVVANVLHKDLRLSLPGRVSFAQSTLSLHCAQLFGMDFYIDGSECASLHSDYFAPGWLIPAKQEDFVLSIEKEEATIIAGPWPCKQEVTTHTVLSMTLVHMLEVGGWVCICNSCYS